MIQKLLSIIILSSLSWMGNAQELQDFDYYFAHGQVSQEAKQYYAHLFDINNDNKTYAILDSVFTKNDETRPFYVFLVSQMLSEAGKNLHAELDIICRHVAELYPSTLIPVLFAGENYINDENKYLWARSMAAEIKLTCGNDLMTCFKKSRSTALENCNPQNKDRLEAMYNMVRKDLGLFQRR